MLALALQARMSEVDLSSLTFDFSPILVLEQSSGKLDFYQQHPTF